MTRAGAGPPTHPPSLVAADWSASLERTLPLLPSSLRGREARYGWRVLHPPGFELHPWAELFTHPGTGAPILGAAPCPHLSRTRSVADLVMVGRMTHQHLRYRAFYLRSPLPLSVAVHERPARGNRTGLLAGAALQHLAHGRLPVAVPRVLSTESTGLRPGRRWWGGGSARSVQQVDVVVEEWLPGRPVMPHETTAVHDLLDAVHALWHVEPVTGVELPPPSLDRARRAFTALAREREHLLWPPDVDRTRVHARVLALLDSNPRVTVGLSHGDPGLGNAVRTGRGGIALVDWEDAGRRPISHDVFKVLASSTLSPQQWSDLHPELPRGRPDQASPAPEQLALVILQFLQGWRHRTARAAHRRALPAHRRRMHRMVQALDVLLA